MEIRQITSKEKSVIDQVVAIHLNTFQGFFLTFMGKGFLRLMYRSYAEYGQSGIFVAEENGRAIGFLAFSGDLSGLYKYMIKKRLIPFAWYSLGAFLRKPSVFMRLVRALLKPAETKREERYMELASIGVSPELASKGVGSRLVDALKKRVDFSVYAYITLETDAEHNEGANHFYQKNGFSIHRAFQTHEGRRMIEYRYREDQ